MINSSYEVKEVEENGIKKTYVYDTSNPEANWLEPTPLTSLQLEMLSEASEGILGLFDDD